MSPLERPVLEEPRNRVHGVVDARPGGKLRHGTEPALDVGVRLERAPNHVPGGHDATSEVVGDADGVASDVATMAEVVCIEHAEPDHGPCFAPRDGPGVELLG